ncbi:GLPGLI family protein [Chryseobacterium oryzae]|uniref:GLPGLI family protein n=1 Tax=Chryseobacterium oryzae TaxID=2929799 RepID=A0ABY4BKK1_9FLAO|nr:GLPGLI family protein [Chryseobacterium oryzae]UOE39284.1 GLPGLI family protein [Chryseobacterium oryzae]
MKIVLLTACVLFFSQVKAQTYRFIYDVEYKKDSAESSITKENYHLDIRDQQVRYYPRDFYIGDSLVANNLPIAKDMKFNTSSILTHQKGSDGYEEYDILENVALKRSSKNTQNWKLSEEKKTVKDLTLQKATTTWGGRNWVAWFAPQIPFNEGPYKFHGLPGLIVELYDDNNNYRFELVKNQKLKQSYLNQFMDYFMQSAVPVNEQKYREAKLKYYDSPINYLRNAVGQTKSNEEFYLNDGTLVKQDNYREVNERLRSSIRKYNNPIELDKVIQYPK